MYFTRNMLILIIILLIVVLIGRFSHNNRDTSHRPNSFQR
jgi:hypothetical protein